MKLWFYFDKAFPDILPLLNVVLEPAEDVGKKEKPQDGEHDEQLGENDKPQGAPQLHFPEAVDVEAEDGCKKHNWQRVSVLFEGFAITQESAPVPAGDFRVAPRRPAPDRTETE